MKILYAEFEYEDRANKGCIGKLPVHVVAWYRKLKLIPMVSWVSECEGGGWQVRLCNGMEMVWRLSGRYYRMRHSGMKALAYVNAIRLTNREVMEIARKEANRILAGVELETRANWTKAKKD